MKKAAIFKVLFFSFSFNLFSVAGSLPDSIAKKFIFSLTDNRNDLYKFILPEELEISKRLGIEYSGIQNKFLISNDLDSSFRKQIINKNLNFTYKVINLDSDYSKLIFSISKLKFTKEYFFKDTFLISPPYYFGRNWVTEKSKFFIFHISSRVLFNHYAEERLDNFVGNICNKLKLNNEQIKNLKKNKIHYYLCKDDSEIKKLTGYDARGLYYLPYDYIITTYNCHYHEILHLLINYKTQNPSLYTLPLFQEGFAVAFGGRGGKVAEVILETGAFLGINNLLNYNSLLSKEEFNQFDATMSYPLAGLYNKFLIYELGINKYFSLYEKYSGDESVIEGLKINLNDLPPDDRWEIYLKNYPDSNSIKIDISNYDEYKEIESRKNIFFISENPDYYSFMIKDTLLLEPAQKDNYYQSKLFLELFPHKKYKSEKYGILADSNEVSIYNFYSNNLIAKYVRNFSPLNKKVEQINNLYQFEIKKKIFNEPLRELKID